jgi:hypothetical protein
MARWFADEAITVEADWDNLTPKERMKALLERTMRPIQAPQAPQSIEQKILLALLGTYESEGNPPSQ